MSLSCLCFLIFLVLQVCTGAKSEQQSKLAARKVDVACLHIGFSLYGRFHVFDVIALCGNINVNFKPCFGIL